MCYVNIVCMNSSSWMIYMFIWFRVGLEYVCLIFTGEEFLYSLFGLLKIYVSCDISVPALENVTLLLTYFLPGTSFVTFCSIVMTVWLLVYLQVMLPNLILILTRRTYIYIYIYIYIFFFDIGHSSCNHKTMAIHIYMKTHIFTRTH